MRDWQYGFDSDGSLPRTTTGLTVGHALGLGQRTRRRGDNLEEHRGSLSILALNNILQDYTELGQLQESCST